jgi:hypothetical protein
VSGRLYYVNMSELVGGVALGVHEVDPQPLGAYSFAQMIHDPVRPRLYGVDTAQAEVVVIDTATLRPTRAIRVNSTPTDLAIDAAGTTLFVGHLDVQGFARIHLDDLTFDRYVVAPRITYEIVAVSRDRVVTIDQYQGTKPSLIDATTGAVLSEGDWHYFGALSTTADGTSLFIGDMDSAGTVTRYSVATDALVATGQASHEDFYFPPRVIAALPDGSGVYYAGALLDGNNLVVERNAVNEPIVAVSPDGRLALSATTVYDVATGGPCWLPCASGRERSGSGLVGGSTGYPVCVPSDGCACRVSLVSGPGFWLAWSGCGRSWRHAGRLARSSPSPWTPSGRDANWSSRTRCFATRSTCCDATASARSSTSLIG